MSVPSVIKALKPTNVGPCEIREISGRYYVYSVTSKWDASKGRSRKITLGCLGKITETDGFIPNKRSFKMPTSVVVKEHGVYVMLETLCVDLYDKLKKYFPDLFREIFTISLMRLCNKCTAADLRKIYLSSSLSSLHPGLSLSENTITGFMKELGQRRTQMIELMQSYVGDNQTLLFDGTNIFASASDSSYSRIGYNHGKKRSSQVNLLYIFDSQNHRPVYYRLMPGNIVDKASMIASIKESGCKNAVIIGDKGFYSKANTAFLDENNMNYILPLQHNTTYISEEWTSSTERTKFDGHFIYHDRVVWYKKNSVGDRGHFVYIFLDEELRLSEEKYYLHREKEEYEGYTMEKFFEIKRNGLVGFMSNLNTKAEEIYLKYKARWEIEECFDYLKNTVKIGACYQRDDISIEAWAFLNHISLIQFYELCNAVNKSTLKNKYNADDIIRICRSIYKVELNNGQSFVSEISASDQRVLDALGVSIT